jgi:two-component system, NtrC family, sensor histidine kinase PilS
LGLPPRGTIPVPMVRRDPEAPSPGESLIAYSMPAPSDLRRRVARLLLLRTFVVTVVLTLSMWLFSSGGDPVGSVVWLQSGLIATTYLSSIVFGVLLRVGVAPRMVARPMWAVDLVVTSAFVYITGGVQSPYTFLYALTIVSAGALSYRRGAVVVTCGAIAAISTVTLLALIHAVDLPQAGAVVPWNQSTPDFARTLGIQIAAQLGVGALAFIFGDQLERGAETLATTRKEAADLFTLHQSIVRSLASGLITIAPDGTVLTANQAAGDILRHPPSELVRKSLDDIMPGLLALISEARGELRRADLKLGDLTLGVTVSLLRDLDDVVIGRVVNFTDLTELRRLELTTRRAERLATVGELAAGVAHEIRNPLAAISGSVELLRAAPQATEDDRALMNIVSREIHRLNGLIGELLDYANPRPIQRVDFDLGVMVSETIQVARADAAFAAVELTCAVDAPLPITADAAKLRQVLWNLLRNAAESGGKRVRLEARGEGTVASFVVEDDGPGIEAKALARMFDPFFTTKRTGTGLGLAQCHGIIAEHGGRIDVDSEVGKGTKMVVSLPRTALPSRQ